MSANGIFDEVIEFPDLGASRRYKSLVGLDEIKGRLLKEAMMLLDPAALDNWQNQHHGTTLRLVELYRERPPLFIFAGDVGTGKTALAECFADPIARNTKVPITLYALSLNARGNGAVGQMTTLISAALAEVRDKARRASGNGSKPTAGVILLVDEADALAQSRESSQMHHEDRAGVNALIRGVDDFATGGLPAIVVLCTNRLDALDPAVRRRAADTFQFDRPNDDQRKRVLEEGLSGIRLSVEALGKLVKLTGPLNGRSYGFTYSDLTQRLLPSVLMGAFPSRPVTEELALDVAEVIKPTPPFGVNI